MTPVQPVNSAQALNSGLREDSTQPELHRKKSRLDTKVDTRRFSVKNQCEQPDEILNKVTTVVIDGTTGNRKILRYDMKALVHYSAFLTVFSEGTVFTMDKTALMNVLIMLIIGSLTCFATCITASFFNFSALTDLDVEPLEALASQINAFVPFCLALYISLTLSRWWTLRISALGRVFDAFANVCMIISCELYESKWLTLRNQVAKYGFASIELLVQASRRAEDLDRLRTLDFLTEEECAAVTKLELLWQRPMIMWAWIMRITVAAMDHNKTPAPRSAAVMSQCISAREGMATINTYLDTQLPFAYVHLITMLVNVQNIVIAMKSGIILATAMPDLNVFLMIQQVVTLLVVCFIYQALLQISALIMDPFGDDVLDFPIQAYTTYLATTIDAMLEAQPDCALVAQDGSLHRPRHMKEKVAKSQSNVDGPAQVVL